MTGATTDRAGGPGRDTTPDERIDELSAALEAGAADAPMLLELAQLEHTVGDDSAALAALRRLARTGHDFRSWVAAARLLGTISPDVKTHLRSVHVAMAATSTADQLAALLPVAALAYDLDVRVTNAGYGQYETAALDARSALYADDVDVIMLAPDSHALHLGALAPDAAATTDAELQRWTGVWSAIRSRAATPILQLNFVPVRERPLGGLTRQLEQSSERIIQSVNDGLARARVEDVHIIDAEAVARDVGLSAWWDERYWFRAKQAVALGALPRLAVEIAAVVGSLYGRSRKCLVVDLDNTLWGGVVGDDGVEHLQLEGSPNGEAHLALQSYLRDLRRSGVILAVCSKNDAETAQAPFNERSDMILQLEDFADFVANWRPKPQNIEMLSERLNLGLDSFVFLDDNPAERALVRAQLPMVDVIDLPADPARYLRAVADYRGFERLSLTDEDLARTDQYRGRTAALDLRASTASLDEFLDSLDMRADITPFDDLTLPRVEQLVQKTNQWNLTTRRHRRGELGELAARPDAFGFSVRLADRFADHGIVAVAIAVQQGDRLDIDTLLMSCRVIGRSLEHALIDHLVEIGRRHDVRALTGTYVPTAKNRSVAEVYDTLGFERVGEHDGTTTWRLAITDTTPTILNHHIEVACS